MSVRMLSTALAIETIFLVTLAGWIVQERSHSTQSSQSSASTQLSPSGKPATSSSDLPADDPRTRHRKWKYHPQTKTVTIVGEVVDSWCYSSQVMGPGRGERHKACALACAHGGVTIGIVDDEGTLFICAKHRAYTGCKELLTPFMAKRVKVLGWLAQKGGCNVLKIADVEEVKDGTTTASAAANAAAPDAAQPSTPGAQAASTPSSDPTTPSTEAPTKTVAPAGAAKSSTHG